MDVRKGWWLAIAAVLLGAALTVPFRHLWEVDEPRYAEVAREMITTGQWLVPHLYGEPYTHKPPLYIWLEGGLRLTGLSWTAAGVLPPLLAFLGILALMPRLARATGLDDGVGRLGAIALAASPLAVFLALGARMDMLLAFFYTLAILMLAQLLGLGPATVPKRRAHLVFWLAIGLGVLTKGPVALALPLLAAVLAWALLRPRPSLRAVFVGWGPLVCVGVVLAWLVPAAIAGGPEYLYEITIEQSAGRMANSFAHREPVYFYLVRYPLIGLPWSVAAVVAVVHALRRRALDAGGFPRPRRPGRAALLLVDLRQAGDLPAADVPTGAAPGGTCLEIGWSVASDPPWRQVRQGWSQSGSRPPRCPASGWSRRFRGRSGRASVR